MDPNTEVQAVVATRFACGRTTIELMDIDGWEERYQQTGRAKEDLETEPTQLVIHTAAHLQPGRALDLACGVGRNALWLARAGWRVKAVDGSSSAMQTLRTEAERQQLPLEAEVADLQSNYIIEESSWDLIVIAYYLQIDLLEKAQRGLASGGLLLVIVHTTEGGEEPTQSRLRPGELKSYLSGWEILHEYEGMPNDSAHKRRVSEIVARRPVA